MTKPLPQVDAEVTMQQYAKWINCSLKKLYTRIRNGQVRTVKRNGVEMVVLGIHRIEHYKNMELSK